MAELPRSEKRGEEAAVQLPEAAVGRGGGDASGNRGGGGGEQAARLDREILVRMDSQVLDCPICFDPLRPPIYEVITTATAHNICCI